MIKTFKKSLRTLIDLGISEELGVTDKFKIRFINGMHYLTIFVLIIAAIYWKNFERDNIAYIKASIVILPITGLVLNAIKHYKSSTLIFYLYSNLMIIYNTELYPKEAAGYVYYFPFALVLGISNLSMVRDVVSYSMLIFSFVIFILMQYVDISEIIPTYLKFHLTEREIYWTKHINITIASLCVIIFTAFYVWLSRIQTEKIQQFITKEKQSNQYLLESLNKKERILAELQQ